MSCKTVTYDTGVMGTGSEMPLCGAVREEGTAVAERSGILSDPFKNQSGSGFDGFPIEVSSLGTVHLRPKVGV